MLLTHRLMKYSTYQKEYYLHVVKVHFQVAFDKEESQDNDEEMDSYSVIIEIIASLANKKALETKHLPKVTTITKQVLAMSNSPDIKGGTSS